MPSGMIFSCKTTNVCTVSFYFTACKHALYGQNFKLKIVIIYLCIIFMSKFNFFYIVLVHNYHFSN